MRFFRINGQEFFGFIASDVNSPSSDFEGKFDRGFAFHLGLAGGTSRFLGLAVEIEYATFALSRTRGTMAN
jgi:hypothetical protein